MDTQKLYNWNKQQNDMNINVLEDPVEKKEAQELNDALIQNKQMDEIGKNIFESDQIKDVSGDDSVIVDKREDIAVHLPPTAGIFSQKQSLIREGKYTFLGSDGTFRKAKRTAPSGKYMKPILDHLKDLDDLLSKKFDAKDEAAIQKCFRDTILSCENYIENRNPWTSEGKARLQMVKDFQKQIRTESVQFEERVAELLKEPKEIPAGKTWISILSEVRTEIVEDGKNDTKVEIGGAGTSKVYIIKKDGKKRYFKENEKMPKESAFFHLDDKVKELKKTDSDIAKRRARYLDIIKRALIRTCGNEKKAYEVLATQAFDEFNVWNLLSNMAKKNHELRTMFDEIEDNSQGLEFGKMTKKELEEKDDEYFIKKTMLEVRKKVNLGVVAKQAAQIEDGAEISKRNVATSRMAKLLGLENLVANSSLVNMTVDGKSMQGIAMEEVKGNTGNEIMKKASDKRKDASYSPDAFKQLLNLQVFDVICGQVDRNESNYLCESQESEDGKFLEITKIKAIDNDLSFGNITYKDLLKTGKNGIQELRNIEQKDKLSMPYMDQKLADAILGLKPKEIDYIMCDILSKTERKALCDRIKGVQKLIRKKQAEEDMLKNMRRKVNSVFIENDKDWKNAYEDYQSRVKAAFRKNPNGTAEKVGITTYLNTKIIHPKYYLEV